MTLHDKSEGQSQWSKCRCSKNKPSRQLKRINNTKCLGNWRGQAGGGVVSGHSLTACFEFLVDMCYIHLSPALQNKEMMQLASFFVVF